MLCMIQHVVLMIYTVSYSAFMTSTRHNTAYRSKLCMTLHTYTLIDHHEKTQLIYCDITYKISIIYSNMYIFYSMSNYITNLH